LPHELHLVGVDGANPLAFLAALGTLNLLSEARTADMRMRWQPLAGAWRPVLIASQPLDENAVVEMLATSLGAPEAHPHLALGKNLSISRDRFAQFALNAQRASSLQARRFADFMASFGSEVFGHESLDRIVAT